MTPTLLALASVLLIGLVSLAGVVTLSLGRARLQRILFLLVSFAVGAMLGGALLHLLPQAYERLGSGPRTGALALAGVMGFFVLEKFLHWRHMHGVPGEAGGDIPHAGHSHAPSGDSPLVALNLAGTVAHNLIDGAIVASSYLVSIHTGLVTTLAVLLHEIPQEIGNFGVLVYGGQTPRRALLYNFLAGLAGLVGAGIALVVGQRVGGFADALLPLTAGAFLYVAGSDLIPELNRRHSHPASKSVGQLVMMALGVALMTIPLLIEGH